MFGEVGVAVDIHDRDHISELVGGHVEEDVILSEDVDLEREEADLTCSF